MPYKLRQTLKEHTFDVRAVCTIDDSQFVTASRDETTIVWDCTNDTNLFYRKRTLLGHKYYINSCCVAPSSRKYPQGLILTGSHDSVICVYDLSSDLPVKTFRGHEDAVSSLVFINDDDFASGSWDSQIKFWNLERNACYHTFTIHSRSVLALLLLNSKKHFISASADKTINVLKWPELELSFTITGHTDCVRSLAALTDDDFLSCSNDGSIRRWNAATGELKELLFSTDTFLYSINATLNGSLIVCGGENGSVIVLNKEGESEILRIPAISVWSVCLLPNRDIVTGSSDGVVRIFTADSSRQAAAGEIDSYEAKVKEILKAESRPRREVTLGDRKMNIPGPEALTKPGQSDGQVLLVRDKKKTECYQWAASLHNWILVGDVTDINPNNDYSGRNKEIFEGKVYDYVFNIDVEDGKPPLKLPFRIGDNPYEVAEAFLIKHNLPMSYRTEIVNYLLQNTPSTSFKSTTLLSEQVSKGEPSFLDHLNNFVSMNVIDFTKAKAKLIELAKIVEGNTEDSNCGIWIDSLVEMAQFNVNPTDDTLSLVHKNCLEWPPEYVFPILDLLRTTVLHENSNKRICDEEHFDLLSIIRRYSDESTSVVNNMLIIKIAVNLFSHKSGQDYNMKYRNMFLNICQKLATKTMKSNALEIGISSWLVNISILQIKRYCTESLHECINASLEIWKHLKNQTGILRILIALGIASSGLAEIYINENNLSMLKELANSTDNNSELSTKINQTSKELLHYIKPKLVVTLRP